MLIARTKPWTREEVGLDSSRAYVFGDNLEQRGRGGQACIRGLPNAYGIPTKKRPAMDDGAFFSDLELEANCRAIDAAIAKLPLDREIIYNPEIGTGLAEMPLRCPMTYARLIERLSALGEREAR